MSKVSLYLAGEKGLTVLQLALKRYKNIISHVVSAKIPGVMNDHYDDLKALCESSAVPFYERSSLLSAKNNKNDFSLAVGWRWMLPEYNSLIVIHDSLLPKYRGFSPLVNCLINGEEIIGATAIYGSKNYDTGEIIKQCQRVIEYPIKVKSAIEIMSEIYAEIALFLFEQIKCGHKLNSTPQDHSLASYSLWRDDGDYWIDWTKSSAEIARFIDAVGFPYLGARCVMNGAVAIINHAIAVEDVFVMDRKSSVGKVLFIEDGFPTIVCTRGVLKILEMTSEDGISLVPLKNFRIRFEGAR